MLIEDIYKIYKQYPSVQTDTRKLKEGDLFFALKGPNFNGNLFAEQALEQGAAFAFVDEKNLPANERIIETGDVLSTLQALAKFHRQQFTKIPFIAITGSNGKTTTKELVHQVLSSAYKTYTTQGNLNNHIGVPLTILKIKEDAEMAVIEMGANHLHEIASYCEYAMPTHGLITNIGKAHLEGFGGVENVKKGKGELFDYIKKHNGTAFVNADDSAVVDLSKGISKKIFYGSSGRDIRGKIIHSDPFPEIKIEGGNSIIIKTKLTGVYNFSNVLAAVCIGRHFSVDDKKIITAIENYVPSNSRSQLIHRGSNTILLDAYNANPGSMQAAIENFAAMKGDKKILLLGAMMELGADSEKEHKALINLIGKYKWHKVVLVGKNFNEPDHNYIKFDTSAQAQEWWKHQHFENAQILIKGSRSMQMEKVLE
ncbi:MAG TPA: UDP-N-acetylmuramoyl-tripeptide--D-alanyl-D-alanine ligase [Chitinophagaceae bacterium]|nr:UDP-N-acetylmuramoyl-tripeptide--D-alanyl-D-alanine ligase [Chitinophagaceae bacterium]